jgi:hypothetical protein
MFPNFKTSGKTNGIRHEEKGKNKITSILIQAQHRTMEKNK